MPHSYATSREKRIDMWLGFAGWFAFALALLLVVTLIRPAFAEQSVLGPLILVTFGAGLALLLSRPYASFGWLLAAATVVALVVVELPFFLASLVVDASGAQRQASTTVAMAVGFAAFLVAAWFSLRGIDRRVQ